MCFFPQWNHTDDILPSKKSACVWRAPVLCAPPDRGLPCHVSLCFVGGRESISALLSHPGLVSFMPLPPLLSCPVQPSSLTLFRAGAEVGCLSSMVGIPEQSLFGVCLPYPPCFRIWECGILKSLRLLKLEMHPRLGSL